MLHNSLSLQFRKMCTARLMTSNMVDQKVRINHLKVSPNSILSNFMLPTVTKGITAILIVILTTVLSTSHGQILWSSATTGGAWLSTANWTGGVVPSTTGYAQFQINPTSTGQVGINMNGSTNNGANNQAVGGIEITGARAVPFVLRNSSTTVNGLLTLNGTTINAIANVVLRNNTTQLVTIENGTSRSMGVVLNNGTDNKIYIDNTGSITITSIISGTGRLTKLGTGAGILTLSTGNTYTGKTFLSDGTTASSGESAFGANPASFTADQITFNGGTLSATGNMDFNSNRGITFTGTASTLNTNANTITLTNVCTGTGGFTKTGTGILSLGATGATHSFSGLVTISAGTLQLGVANRYPDASALSVSTGATFNLNNFNETIGSLAGIGSVTLGTATLTAGNDNSSTTYSGVASGTGGLTKSGTGTMTLSGGNTFTGATTISTGILQLGAAGVIANTSNVVLNGGTLSTGAAAGFSETAGTLNLNANSTIALGTGNHTLTFANSSSETWAGSTLTITGWTGTGGASGTAGKIVVGAGGLTAGQLAKISFTGFPGTPVIVSGEVVPPSAGIPTIALSSPSQTAAANVNPSTNNVILSHFQAGVTVAAATLNTLAFTTTGSYLAADLSGTFSLFYHSTSTFASATSIGTVAIGTAGTFTFTGLSQAISSGASGYFWIVANTSAISGANRTLTVSASPVLTFATGSPTGTISAGGTKTLLTLVPSIAISSSSPGASNHNAGSTDVVLQRIDLAVTVADASLTGLTVTTAGTYTAADLTNLKVRYSADAVLDAGDATLSTKTTGLGAGSQVFPSFGTQVISSGTTGYLFVTADITSTATGGNTINLASTAFSNITFGSGTLTGTDPVAAGNIRTIINPSIAISGTSPAASTQLQGSTNVVLHRFDFAVTSSNATLTGISVTTAGTYVSADVSNLKVRYSTDAVLDGGDATLSTLTTPGVAGSKTFPSFTSQIINSGTTGYIFITADLSATATSGNTISLASTAFSNLTFSLGNKTGTDPVVTGNAMTFVKAEPSNHPTLFACGTTTTATIPLSFTAATGAVIPDGYVIRWSSTSYAAIPDPVDGTVLTNGAGIQNVTASPFTVTGLVQGTTYFFKIWSYTNSGSNINYKLVGEPQTSCATLTGPCLDEGFSAGTAAPSGWTFTAIGGTYTTGGNFGASSPSLQFDNTSDRVTTPTLSGTAIELSFWIKGQGTNATSALLVEGFDGTTWSTIQNITSSIPTTGTTFVYNSGTVPALAAGLTQFRFTYTKTAGNLAFDDVLVTCTPTCTAPTTTLTVTPANATTGGADISWTGSAGDGSMVVVRMTSNPNGLPSSGTIYTANTAWASAGQINTNNRVVFRASGSSVSGITGLTAETQYTATVYNYNNTGNCYQLTGPASNTFYTLSNEPAAHAASFTAAPDSPTQITLNFSAASSITNADGYLIFRKTGSAPTFTPADATAYTVSSTYGDAVLVANISSTATTSFVNSGLSSSTSYHYILVPYNWNASASATYNYRTSATIPSVIGTTPSPVSEINVQGNATSIADGDLTPASADHTDFGGVLVSAGTILRTFTIQNTGSASLNLTGAPLVSISGANAGDFTVSALPSSPVAASGSTTFQVTFNPSASGLRTATISIDNNDPDENPYDFAIQGTGLVPEIQLEQPIGTSQACGFNYDFGSQLVASNSDITIRIQNTGSGILDLTSATLSGLDASEFSIQTFPGSNIANGTFDDLVLRFSPVTGGSKVAVLTILSSDDDEGTCTINLYGEGDASPVVPILSSPVVSGILNTSATIGATIITDGNATITARGTVWKTSSPVTAADNALAEGGTTVSSFTQSRTGLPSGTRIYYRGYATNSAGTGLSPESSFFTLSNEPSGNGAAFSATAISATQINLSFSAASSIPASGYLILMKSGSAVTGTPNDATTYAVNDAIGDANVVGLITSATTFSVTGLSSGTNYHFALVPYNWNGIDNQTRNYFISPLKVANATTSAASLPVLGDIAFVAYATDDPDRFAFVALADIAANAQITFTDNAWSASSALCVNESNVVWQAPASGLSKGTVVRIQAATANVGTIVSGSLTGLSTSGDQIFAYTGTSVSPSFIAGLSTTTLLGTCQACGTSTTASCLPATLTNGVDVISFASHSDNGYYDGDVYGTVATLRSAINNPANWVRSNTTQTWPTPWTFTIGNVSITTGTITGSPFCITNTVGISVSVPFTTGGVFETGNVFTAQLSDGTGDFSIPTNIGTGTISPISATVPAGTLSGSGYRIRVISSDPEANGLQNTSNLTIYLNTPDVTGVSALRQNSGAIVSWTNPGGCWDEVMVVAQPTNSFTSVPSGNGSAYTANSTFGSGTAFGTGGFVLYKGIAGIATFTGFTNSTTYFVKTFVRKGTVWSDGVEVSVVPSPDITGDFRSRVASGNWSNFLTWERYNGTAWVNATSGQFPDNTTTTVTILNGQTITVDGSSDPYDVNNIIVASGGKLYANLTSGNRYLNVYGDITCNGTIGNGSTFDGISFNIEGLKVTISGTGTFDASRIRKNTNTPNATSDLIIAMNVNLRWNSASGTTIYNNVGANSRFNVTVNENSTLSCILAAGGTSGNASIDGVDGGNAATTRQGGTFTINGTMNIPGILYATTDNDATGGFFCKWVIGSTGVINCRQLDCSASGAAGHTLEIKQGGKLNINNNDDNTVNPVVNFSTTNNTFTFATGSIIEYSSSDLTGSQKIFINAGFPYQDLLLSNVSIKQLQTAATLNVGGDLRITGGILDIQSNNIDLKGNWENYSQAGFTEGTNKVTFSGTGRQTIQCPGGEQFYNVDVTNSSVAGVELNADVTLANDLDLGTNGKLTFGATPQILTLSKMTSSANTFKGSGTASIDMSSAEHTFIIGCPDPGYTGTLSAGTTSTIIYNRDEDFAGSNDDQNILTGFSYANLLLTGKGNKVISDNLNVNSSFTAETPDLVIVAPVSAKSLTLGGNFLLNSGASMNDNCRDNLEILTTGNASQVFNTNTKNLKAFNLKSTKSAGGISLTGGAADQTTVNLKNDFALNYTATAVFSDNGNTINVGDDAELGSAGSTISNFAFSGLLQFNGLGASTDIHLSDFAGTGAAKAELNNITVRAGENSITDQLEVYPLAGGQSITIKGNFEIIQGANSSEFDLNGNKLFLKGNWTSYDENAFNEGTTSSVVMDGTTVQTITVPVKEKFAQLEWNNSLNLVITSDIEVVTDLTVTTGEIQTGSNKVILGSTATISEDENNHVVGRVLTTRTLTLANQTFGGLGLEIDANGSAPGVTVVNRYTGTPVTGAGNSGITRKFSIVPATNAGLDAKLTFAYWETEINGLDENSFQLFRSTDGGITWTAQTGSPDGITNTVVQNNIDGFSEWTLADANVPLLVSMTSFTGKAGKGYSELFWNTATEKENAGFRILRSVDGHGFKEVGFVKTKGSGSETNSYVWKDPAFDQSYFYKLVWVNQDKKEESSRILFLNCDCNKVLDITLYPNPVTDKLSLVANQNLSDQEVFELELTGLDGKKIYSNHSSLGHLENLLQDRVLKLPQGLYQIHLYNGRYNKLVRFRKE